jgi:DNA-directed RNA polymerase subunit alpha
MKKIKTAPFIPNQFEVDTVSANEANISIYPFETGYAITLAHPLKRLILSSTVGYAPTSMSIEGAEHEFDSVRGVLEDVASLIINLKNLRFKITDESDKVEVKYTFSGSKEIKGSDFNNEFVEVVTPDAHFATINEDGELTLSIVVEKGMGYVPSEDTRETAEPGYLPLDAYFMPVKKANYSIENVLVEDNPNYEKIVFNVVTDGATNPNDVFQDAVKTMLKQIEVFGAEVLPSIPTKVIVNKEDDELVKKMMMKIEDLNLSARSHNCLTRSSIKYVGEIVRMSESELAKVKNLGKKSLEEIIQKLDEMNFGSSNPVSSDIMALFDDKIAELN